MPLRRAGPRLSLGTLQGQRSAIRRGAGLATEEEQVWRPDVTSLATLALTAFLVPAVIIKAVMSEDRSYPRGVALADHSTTGATTMVL